MVFRTVSDRAETACNKGKNIITAPRYEPNTPSTTLTGFWAQVKKIIGQYHSFL